MLKLRWCGAMVLGLISGASLMTAEPQATNAPAVVEPPADVTLTLAAETREGAFTIERAAAGKARILVQGLKLGGHVEATLDRRPVPVELLASGGLEAGRADQALIEADLPAGRSALTLKESEGVQVVRVRGTRLYFGTTSRAAGHALFSMDMTNMRGGEPAYPLTVYYGEDYKPFYWFNGGKLDCYYGEFFVATVHTVRATSGPAEATLSFEVDYPPRDLSYTTVLTLGQGNGTEVVPLRVRHIIRKTGPAKLPWNLEFLHLVINERYGADWEDGVPDWFWHRVQVEDAPNALPGSHTQFERMDDNSLRQFIYPISHDDPTRLAISSGHHTSNIADAKARNTIGGWFTKTGVGCIGLVWHRYTANWRDDLYPAFGNCGDGADTHFYACWAGMFGPLGMDKAGDMLDIEYSLFCLPSEPLHTDVDDLNEADLLYFGKEAEQLAPIVGFVGSKEGFGLLRGDGSMIVLGIGREPGRIKVPPASRAAARRVYRFFDPGRPSYQDLEIAADGTVEVRPRWLTVVDAGAALIVPPRYAPPARLSAAEYHFEPVPLEGVGNRPLAYPWMQAPPRYPGRFGCLGFLGGVTPVGGVPFLIETRGRGVLALAGPPAEGAAPPPYTNRAEVAVGRPADALYFLHGLGAGRGFRYVVHYEDGVSIALAADDRCLARTDVPHVWEFAATEDGLRGTLGAAIYSLQTGRPNETPRIEPRRDRFYRLEWLAPEARRATPIRAIEVLADEPGTMALLLGITTARRKP